MSLKEQQEYGDDLAVLFIEAQGHSMEAVEKFALKHKWLGGSSLWTTERAVPMNGRGLPHFVLLDVEGKTILEGNPLAMTKQIQTALHEQVGRRQRGPEDLPKELRGIWKDRARGKYADAIEEAEKLAANPPSGDDGAAIAEAAARLALQVRADAEAALRRVDTLIAAGSYQRAGEFLTTVEKGIDGLQALEVTATEIRVRLESDDLETERGAEKAFAKLERAILQKGIDAVPARSITRFADKYQGTKAAERAQHLLALITE